MNIDPANPMAAMMAEAMEEAFAPMVRAAVKAELEPVLEALTDIKLKVDDVSTLAYQLEAAIEKVKAKGGMLAKFLGD